MSWYNALNSLFSGKNSEKRSRGPVYPGANDIYTQMALAAQSKRGSSVAYQGKNSIYDQIGYYSTSKSGAVVNDTTILGIPAMWAAIRIISGTLASMESGVLRRTSDGVEEATGHPIYGLFSGRPHPYYTKYDFIHALVTNACLGDGYARIHWGPDGRPYALEILPSNCTWQEFLPNGEMVYRVTGKINRHTQTITLPASDVIHVKGFVTVDAVTGRRVSITHKETLGGAISSIDFPAEYFSNGVHIPGFLSRPEIIGVDEAEIIQRKVANAKGVANAGGMPFFDGGMKFERVGQTMQEAALIDFRKLSVEETSRITGVPLHMLSENTHSTFTNMEQQSSDYITHCVNHWAVKLEQEFTTKLFTPGEVRRRSYFYNFDVESLIRGDTAAIAQLIKAVIPHSVMTPDEVRGRYFKMNKTKNGDRLLAQVNMTFLDTLEDMHDKTSADGSQDNNGQNNNDNGSTDQPDAAN